MSQIYLNGPSVGGRSMSAEEFAAGVFQQPGAAGGSGPAPGGGTAPMPFGNGGRTCGCGGTMPAMNGGCGCDCDHPCRDDCDQDRCCEQMVCCCRPVHQPCQPLEVDEGCCCKQSFRSALGLLCDQQISNLLDFDAAAFITDTYTAGTTLGGSKAAGAVAAAAAQADDAVEAAADNGNGNSGNNGNNGNNGNGNSGDSGSGGGKPNPPSSNGPSDNLGDLEGSFRRFSPCSCDLLEIDAEVYTAGGKGCDFTATQVSLCDLDAVAIQVAKACAEGDLSDEQATARNFRCLRQRLTQRLNPSGTCGQDQCGCDCDCQDCCCAAGLLSTLARNNLSRRVSLVAGLLILSGVTLLGTVGSVLVLANDKDNIIYFVCVNSVQFIG